MCWEKLLMARMARGGGSGNGSGMQMPNMAGISSSPSTLNQIRGNQEQRGQMGAGLLGVGPSAASAASLGRSDDMSGDNELLKKWNELQPGRPPSDDFMQLLMQMMQARR